jgi:hypothetical protein
LYGCSKKEKENVSQNQEEVEGDKLKITKFKPELPARIAFGEYLVVTVEYNINSVEQAQIFVRPLRNGRGISGCRSHGCRPIDKGEGLMKGYFYFNEPAVVDEVLVKMVNAKDKSQVCTSISQEISAEWIANDPTKLTKEQLTGDRLKIKKFNPELPASIAVGEKLKVTIGYDIKSVEQAQIFVHPLKNGRGIRGCRSSGCSPLEKGIGELESYFYFNEPAVVDEVRVTMVNTRDQSKVYASISREISAEWVVNPLN